ncbi:amine oxidase [Jaminaea rosea]|uniref:monoamine oxidase n=1 Tax=Jaminaea rosea TaxID=1569628 RepID=A0A316ULR4_9BASI|nr:amine oxidase [Jaminaea rosea]PWN25321.1 amine oxidase [Jaminaea rosea]
MMPATEVEVAIIGGGISGLYAAKQLQRRGVTDLVIIEAQPELGGRVLSTSSIRSNAASPTAVSCSLPSYDLGGAWHWPAHQAKIKQIFEELGVQTFADSHDGDLLVEQSSYRPPTRWSAKEPESVFWRVQGGMTHVVNTLKKDVEDAKVLLSTAATAITTLDGVDKVRVDCSTGTTITASHVLLAIPARIAAAKISFEPALPSSVRSTWESTPTWMAAHAKYVCVYSTPFWRDEGILGQVLSTAGPLSEIHDVTDLNGTHGGLFGFFALDAQARAKQSDEELKRACRGQMVRLFGPKAAEPLADYIKDWSRDPFIATEADARVDGGRGPGPSYTIEGSSLEGKVRLIVSEASPEFTGYLAGAFMAAERGVEDICKARR